MASGTSRGDATSTWCSRTGRSSPATPIPRVVEAVQRPPPTAPLRRPHRAGGALAEEIGARVPSCRDGPVGVERDRGDDVRHSGGARLHRPAQGGQVRRQLPRPRRPVAGRGRQRAGRARPAGIGRGDGGGRPDTVVVPYNRRPTLDDETACVIVEPIAANMGLVPPEPGFLAGLRRVRSRRALLVFDEVITGSGSPEAGPGAVRRRPRPHDHGQGHRRRPRHRAYGGRADVMGVVAAAGPVYQAGTLSGNPLATAAGLAVLDLLDAAAHESLRRSAEAWPPGSGRFRRRRRDAHVPVASTLVGPPSRHRSTDRLRGRGPPTRPATPSCSTRCSTGAWPWHRGPTRSCSPDWPTPTP